MQWFKTFIERHRNPAASLACALGNAEAMRDANPRFFSIPRAEQRASRQVGDTVMLFLQAPGPQDANVGENISVVISQVSGGRYWGKTDEALKLFPSLEEAEFEFGPEHIVGAILPASHVIPYAQNCLVSAAFLQSDAWPQVVVREAARQTTDSGWRICGAGEEVADATHEINVHQAITKFQVLDSVLDEPGLAVWQWDAEQREYRRSGR